MVQVIYGKKGSGKTKRILDMANAAGESAKGNVVFIDDDKSYMYDLKYQVRFVNASEYHVSDAKTFLGFLLGMMAKDFDLEEMYVDGLLRITREDLDSMENFFKVLEELSDQHKVRVVLSVSGADEELPDYLKPYLI